MLTSCYSDIENLAVGSMDLPSLYSCMYNKILCRR